MFSSIVENEALNKWLLNLLTRQVCYLVVSFTHFLSNVYNLFCGVKCFESGSFSCDKHSVCSFVHELRFHALWVKRLYSLIISNHLNSNVNRPGYPEKSLKDLVLCQQRLWKYQPSNIAKKKKQKAKTSSELYILQV